MHIKHAFYASFIEALLSHLLKLSSLSFSYNIIYQYIFVFTSFFP